MSREIDRDARDMLNRYNNKRRQLWNNGNNPEWKQANDHKLVLPLAPFSNENTGRLKVKKGDTYEFDLNPWYIHFTPFTQENTGFKFFLLTFRMSSAVMISLDWNNPEYERSATFPECWLIFPSENIEEGSIFSFLEEMEGMSDENVDFPIIPVGNGGEHGHAMVDDLFQGMGIDETRDGRQGVIMSLRTYLQNEEASIAKDALFSYDNNPLMFEKIIVFDKEYRTNIGNVGMVFWLKNYSYIGTTGNETTENVIKLLYGSTTTKETINRQPRDVRHSILTALGKELPDGRQLDSDVMGYIGRFGGKKKRKSLKNKRKTKRKRKTIKSGTRGGGNFVSRPTPTPTRHLPPVEISTTRRNYNIYELQVGRQYRFILHNGNTVYEGTVENVHSSPSGESIIVLRNVVLNGNPITGRVQLYSPVIENISDEAYIFRSIVGNENVAPEVNKFLGVGGRKTKRRKSLKKKQRKTKRKGRR